MADSLTGLTAMTFTLRDLPPREPDAPDGFWQLVGPDGRVIATGFPWARHIIEGMMRMGALAVRELGGTRVMAELTGDIETETMATWENPPERAGRPPAGGWVWSCKAEGCDGQARATAADAELPGVTRKAAQHHAALHRDEPPPNWLARHVAALAGPGPA